MHHHLYGDALWPSKTYMVTPFERHKLHRKGVLSHVGGSLLKRLLVVLRLTSSAAAASLNTLVQRSFNCDHGPVVILLYNSKLHLWSYMCYVNMTSIVIDYWNLVNWAQWDDMQIAEFRLAYCLCLKEGAIAHGSHPRFGTGNNNDNPQIWPPHINCLSVWHSR